MTDTLRFQCQNCGDITTQNPRTCPSCGESVMRPVETSEPDAPEHEFRTDDFDIEQAVSRLDTSDQDRQNQSQADEDTGDRSESAPDDEGRGFVARLKALF